VARRRRFRKKKYPGRVFRKDPQRPRIRIRAESVRRLCIRLTGKGNGEGRQRSRFIGRSRQACHSRPRFEGGRKGDVSVAAGGRRALSLLGCGTGRPRSRCMRLVPSRQSRGNPVVIPAEEVAELWVRAQRALSTARLLATEDPDACASRACDAAFHAASAWLASTGRSYNRHSAAEAAAHRDLVRPGFMTAELGAGYTWLQSIRSTGDYGGPCHVTAMDAEAAVAMAEKNSRYTPKSRLIPRKGGGADSRQGIGSPADLRTCRYGESSPGNESPMV
jgi:uncharacterized protein (UPF0332 family)